MALVDVGGICADRVATNPDDPCQPADPCVAGSHCVLVAEDFDALVEGTCVAPATSRLWASCANDGDCIPGLFCSETGICVDCDDTHACTDGNVCGHECDEPRLFRCAPPGVVGDDCDDGFCSSGFARPCSPDLDCVAGVCAAPGSVGIGGACVDDLDCASASCIGSTCAKVNECASDDDCVTGKVCEVNDCGSKCVAPLNVGDVCSGEAACAFQPPCGAHSRCFAVSDIESDPLECVAVSCESDADCPGGFCDGFDCEECHPTLHPCADGFLCSRDCNNRFSCVPTPSAGDVCDADCFSDSGAAGPGFDSCAPGFTCFGACTDAQRSGGGFMNCATCCQTDCDGGPDCCQ